MTGTSHPQNFNLTTTMHAFNWVQTSISTHKTHYLTLLETLRYSDFPLVFKIQQNHELSLKKDITQSIIGPIQVTQSEMAYSDFTQTQSNTHNIKVNQILSI